MGVEKLKIAYPTRMWEHLDLDSVSLPLPMGEEDEWVMWLGIPCLNSQRPTATWPFEY